MAASTLRTTNSRAERFCYPEPLQPLTKINIHSLCRNKFITAWTDRNAAIADGRRFPEIVEKVIEGILHEAATIPKHELAKDEISPEHMAAEFRKVQNSAEQEILKCIVRLYTYETFLYRRANCTLRNEDMSKVNTLGAFCFLLQLYIFNSPQDTILNDGRKCNTLYRAVSFETEEECKKEVIKCEKNLGQPRTWLGFTSSSKVPEEARKFLNSDNERCNIMYIIDIASNRHASNRKVDISMISTRPSEKEVLFMSGCQFNIDKIQNEQTTTIYVSS